MKVTFISSPFSIGPNDDDPEKEDCHIGIGPHDDEPEPPPPPPENKHRQH